MRFSDYSHVVWDFNGTILDDVGIGIEAVNLLLSRRGLPVLRDADAYREVFGFPIEDYYRRLGFDFKRESYKVVAHEWVREYRAREATAPVREGVRELLTFVRERGIPQSVISASESGMLKEQLSLLGVSEYFEEICGMDNIYAASKTEMARAWAKKRAPGRVLMIGDTDHDAETAKAAGFDLVLVAGGHTKQSVLESTGAPVFESFYTLLETMENDVDF